ncbi:MAG: Ig-like domain-containing protein [Methanomassiliicoccus sp.]|nr:Ig-like domain-containing protein [Methanomassiliicoccus sp.]
MGRSLAILVAVLVILCGSVALAPSTGTVAATGTLTLDITSPQQNTYVQTPYVVITWDATDTANKINPFEIYVDSQPTALTTTSYQMNLTALSDGRHTVSVRATNDVGDWAEDSVMFYIDTTAPVLRILTPSSNSWLNTSDVTVTWQASSSVGIVSFDARLDSNPWTMSIPSSQTSTTFQNVTNGAHNVTVVAHAWGGKTSTAVVAFSVDTTVPEVSITYPGDDAGFNHGDITVVWSGHDAGNNIVGYQIWTDGARVTTAVPGENHFNTNFADGTHTVRIVAVDMANNTAIDEVTFLIDTVRPAIVSKTPTGDQEPVGTTVEVNFSKVMSVQETSLSIDGIPGSMSWNGTLLTFTPTSALAYGTAYHVTLNATDRVGNVIQESWSFTTTDMGTISGVVLDNNGNPMSGVKVALEDGSYVVTASDGGFSLEAHAGPHNVTLSKLGYDAKTVTVSLQPGQILPLGSVAVNPTNPLAIYGILAAIGAVVIVGILYYFGRRGKKLSRPQYRSMRGMEDLQKRASKKGRGRKNEDEDDDEEVL